MLVKAILFFSGYWNSFCEKWVRKNCSKPRDEGISGHLGMNEYVGSVWEADEEGGVQQT